MAVVLMSGFDKIAAADFTKAGWSANPQSIQAGQVSGSAFRLSNTSTGTLLSRALPSAYGTLIVGFAFMSSAAPTTHTLLRIMNGTTRICDLQRVLSGSNSFLRVLNAAGATVATGTSNTAISTWYYVELKITVGTSGTVEVHLNGVSEIASTVGNFGSLNADHIQLMNTNSNSSTVVNTDFDDLFVIDTSVSPNTTYLADSTHIVHIETLYPDSDGSHTDWTPLSGVSHYVMVNETPADGDTSYVFTSTVAGRDSYTVNDLSFLTSVAAVQRSVEARTDISNTLATVARPTTTDHDGPTKTLTTGYVFYTDIDNVNPDTSAAWTVADVNGAEFGIKLVS